MRPPDTYITFPVDRRIGGLESALSSVRKLLSVDRRIGGLENAGLWCPWSC